MGDIIRRMLWFLVIACVVAYGTFLLAGSIVNAQAGPLAAPVVIRDEVSPASHQLSGMVNVPSSCYQLTVKTEAISETAYNLDFETWQDSAVSCSSDPVPRHFSTILAAPSAGVDIYATLDGSNLPIEVVPVVPEDQLSP